MKITDQINSIVRSGGNISDITDGTVRLNFATKGLQSLVQTGIQLTQQIDNQFNSFSKSASVRDLYMNYQTALNHFKAVANQANSILKTAQRGGSLTIYQAQTLEKLGEKANKVIAKLKEVKKELIRRRLEGDDEFDGRDGAAPMLLISAQC